MEQKKMWTIAEVSSLISKWKLLPELWDMKTKNYKNKFAKRGALKTLAAAFETSETEIIRKLHNLRTQFHQELRRRKKNEDSGNACRRTWLYFDEVKFIIYDTSDNTETTHNSKKHKRIETKVEDIEFVELTEEDEPVVLQEKPIQKKARKTVTEQEDPLQETVPVMNKGTDEFKIFGDFVASELRNIRSREHQRQLKLAIQRSILEFAEIDGGLHT